MNKIMSGQGQSSEAETGLTTERLSAAQLAELRAKVNRATPLAIKVRNGVLGVIIGTVLATGGAVVGRLTQGQPNGSIPTYTIDQVTRMGNCPTNTTLDGRIFTTGDTILGQQYFNGKLQPGFTSEVMVLVPNYGTPCKFAVDEGELDGVKTSIEQQVTFRSGHYVQPENYHNGQPEGPTIPMPVEMGDIG